MLALLTIVAVLAAENPPVTIQSGSVTVGPGAKPLVDVRHGVAEYRGARLAGAVFRIRSRSEIALAGRCGRTLSVRAAPGLRVRAGRVTSEASEAARWKVVDGCRRTVIRVQSGQVRVVVGGRTVVLRRGQSFTR